MKILSRFFFVAALSLLLASCNSGGGSSSTASSGSSATSTSGSSGAAINLAKTGQTTCYDTVGTPIACAGTGQDGDLQKGVAWPVPRFVNNADGTVTDNLTGLMWMAEANCILTFHAGFDGDATPNDGLVFWQTALDFVDDVNAATYGCGVSTPYTDWRLPNRKELWSLVDFGQSPALPAGHPFVGAISDFYWSSSSYALDPTNAWVVSLDKGSAYLEVKDFTGHKVWLVRAGQ